MHNPFIHPSLEVRRISRSKFGVFTKTFIMRGTLLEMCPMLPISKKVETLIRANSATLATKLFPNPDGVKRESDLIASMKEMELEKRLDAGLLTQQDIKEILLDSGSLMAVMEVDTACILQGFGSIYNLSSYPNVAISFDSENKLYEVIAVQDIQAESELTYLSA